MAAEYLTEKEAIRSAMLKEQSVWLEEADTADSFTQIAIAKIIAEAFEKAAAKYKTEGDKGSGHFLGTLSWHFDDNSPETSGLADTS